MVETVKKAPWMMAVFCALVVMAGCASPEQRLRIAVDVYATTVELLADYRTAGLITEVEATEIEGWRADARAALDAWREALDGGLPTGTAIEAWRSAAKKLEAAMLRAKRRKANG